MDRDNPKMTMNVDTERVLMSEALRGQVPELEGEERPDELSGKHVVVAAEMRTGGQKKGLVGILRGVHLGAETEIEFRIDLTEALDIIKAPALSFGGFELHHEEKTVVAIPGPFVVKACRIDEIDPAAQLCTIGLHLVKQQR